MHDLAVVGAGPAGSRLARGVAERGHDVVVLERGEVGRPLACSGHVSGDVWGYLPEGARDALLQNEIRGARFHVDGEDYAFYKDETVSYAIDRVGMDRVLADEARSAGADVRTDSEVTDVTSQADAVTVHVEGGDDVRARLAAGCDGPRSTVRDSVGLPESDEVLQGVLAFTDEDDGGDFVDVHLDVPEFFGWRIPRGDSVEYGAACPRGAEAAFAEHVAPDRELTRRCAGHIPIGPPERTVSVEDRVFLVGDAVGQTKPFTGGGIIYGMRAADVAADVVDPTDPATLREYEAGWRDELTRDIRLGGLIRRGYTLPSRVQRWGLKAFQGEIEVHMDRPTTVFNRRTARRVIGNVLSPG
jgi:geranylgeranyl reductase family protein